MTLPVHRRDFDIFLSHAHKDQAFVAELDAWLRKAGFKVWLDARELAGGARLATDLQRGIERCRAILLVAAEQSLERGWVKDEYNAAMDERANHPDFRVLALRVANANVSELMKGTTWIDLPGPSITEDAALRLAEAFYPGENRPDPATARDLYVSGSWRAADGASARAVCRALVAQGFRLIGDARDQEGFGRGNRIERIVSSCGAFVGIVPFRDAASATPVDQPYMYFLYEMDVAAKLGLPSVVVADPRVRRADTSDEHWLRMDTGASSCPAPVVTALEALWEAWQTPPRAQYAFFATDLQSEVAGVASRARHLIERVTGMHTIVGKEIHASQVRLAITTAVRDAFLVIADITDDNVNTCIEAGMALAAGTNLELIAQGPDRRPPFMLGDVQLATYKDGTERIGVLHGIARRFRRRVINAEL